MQEKSDEINSTDHSQPLYQCSECGLHYTDKQMVQKCAAFCKEHNACSIDITKHSVESQQK